MTRDEFWTVAVAHEQHIVDQLTPRFWRAGVEVDGIYLDTALDLIEKLDTLDAKHLPGLLFIATKRNCLDAVRKWDDDPARRVERTSSKTNPETGKKCEVDVDLKPEIDAAWAAWRAEERHHELVEALDMLPQHLVELLRLYSEGYTLEELATQTGTSVWSVRMDLAKAKAQMRAILEGEPQGMLKPREHGETPRHKAAREAIEAKCAQLRRPTPGSPSMRPSKPLDPRAWWFSKATIAWKDWMAEVAARIARGEKHPYIKPQPPRSIDHKLYDLILFAERTTEKPDEYVLPLAA